MLLPRLFRNVAFRRVALRCVDASSYCFRYRSCVDSREHPALGFANIHRCSCFQRHSVRDGWRAHRFFGPIWRRKAHACCPLFPHAHHVLCEDLANNGWCFMESNNWPGAMVEPNQPSCGCKWINCLSFKWILCYYRVT